jgi:hypothetical protein
MALRKLVNGGADTLAFDCDSGNGTMTVSDASGFPDISVSGTYYLVVWDKGLSNDPTQAEGWEIVEVTGAAGNVLTITRGVGETDDEDHLAGDAVEHILLKEHFDDIETVLGEKLAAADGDDGTVTVVTAIQDNAGTIEYKTRDLTVAGGQITAIGSESSWTST